MIKKSSVDLNTPAHQPIKSIFVIFWQSFGGLIRSFWPVLLYFFISSKSGNNWWLVFGSIGLAMLSFFFGILRYYHFLYHVEQQSLIISSGLLTKVTKDIPFERIQSIRLEQKFVHRLLNLYSVRIDTAGSAKEEIEIPALDHETASQLKELIGRFDRKKPVTRSSDQSTIQSPADELVFQLSIVDILKLGITANHIRNFFIIVGLLIGISTQLGEIDSNYRIDRWIEYVIDNQSKFQFQWQYLLLIPFAILVSMVASIGISLFRNFNLRVHKTPTGYRVNQGLINRQEQFAPIKKIQIFRWTISPLRVLLGLYNVHIKQASSSEMSSKQSIHIPGAKIDDVYAFVDRVFGHYTFDHRRHLSIHPKFLYRFFVLLTVLPCLILAGVFWYTEMTRFILISLFWALTSSLALARYYQVWKLTINEHHVQLRTGVFAIRRQRIFMYKLQGVKVYQTPYQSRNDLANVELYTAAGNLSIPYIRLSEAQELANLLLYKIESSRRPWM